MHLGRVYVRFHSDHKFKPDFMECGLNINCIFKAFAVMSKSVPNVQQPFSGYDLGGYLPCIQFLESTLGY